jgi:hypothetical protein
MPFFSSPRLNGPDFICIGMQKAGTAWLYDAFKSQEKFCMLPIKEMHHFNYRHVSDVDKQKFHIDRLQRAFKNNKGVLDPDIAEVFTPLWNRYISSELGDEEYKRLFSIKGSRLSGDITPAYSTLSTEEVNRIYDEFPHVKILLAVRHPVDRVWSHFNMSLRHQVRIAGIGKKSKEAQEYIFKMSSERALRKFIVSKKAASRSYPSRVYDNWAIFGEKNLKLIDFSALAKNSKQVFQETLDFLLPRKDRIKLGDDFSIANRKSDLVKAKFTEGHREILERHFSNEITKCREYFSDIAKDW